jgi:hypothetical protein
MVVFAVLGGVGFLPLFGGPGYEHSLASGLVVPSAAAIATALEVSALEDSSPLAMVRRGLSTGAILAAVALATALLHGIRVGICDLWGGLVFFVLTAGFGAVLGGAWGALAGEACRRRRRRRLACVLLALAGPLAGIAVSIGRFYGSPMIFAFDPFVGFFSGTLYDTVVDVRPELWTYRAGTLATLAGVTLLAAVWVRDKGGRLRLPPLHANRRALAALAAGVAAFTVSLALTADGAALGHWQTAATIARALGGRAAGARCDVVYPDSLSADQAALLVRDCEEELSADERRLNVTLSGRLTAFVFADANEKRRLMGAAATSIAKPWRREVYVQFASYPHPVLGHEIAHVVAGTFARWPFRVGGRVLPNPGLIEGVAVATSPDDDELTDGQWARAMLDLGILPEIRPMFSLEFLGSSAQKSYTVAGAFVTWVLGKWGPAVVRTWYGGGSIEELTGEPWSLLDSDFRASLGTLTMPPEALAYARAKFERPSVWARRCPHVVDALDRDGDRCRDDHQVARADVLYSSALRRDPNDWHARFSRARLALQLGSSAERAKGRDDLTRMGADDEAPRNWRDRAEEALADDDLANGRDDRASEAYRGLAGRTVDEDAARTLEVKALGAADPSARRVIVDLLLSEPGRPPDSWLGALSLGAWAERTKDPMAEYLVGRNLATHGEWARASVHLDGALDGGLPTARMGREALKQRAICACVLKDTDALTRLKGAVLAPDSPFASSSGGRRDWLLALLLRCEGS